MTLNNKIYLCYVSVEDLRQWIEENNLLNQAFTSEKEKWSKEINQKPNFFSDTELVLIYQDILILKVLADNQVSFLAKTYRLEYQTICQKLFQTNKNVIIVTNRQWKEPNNDEKAIFLFKDKEDIEKNLVSWLKEVTV